MPASVPGYLIRPERAPGQRIELPFWEQAPSAIPLPRRPGRFPGSVFAARARMHWQRAATAVIQPALVVVGPSRPVLIKIGFGPGPATLVIAIGAERGQNSLVTIASWPVPRMAGWGGGAKAGRQHVCDLVLVGDRACRSGHCRDRIRHSNQ